MFLSPGVFSTLELSYTLLLVVFSFYSILNCTLVSFLFCKIIVLLFIGCIGVCADLPPHPDLFEYTDENFDATSSRLLSPERLSRIRSRQECTLADVLERGWSGGVGWVGDFYHFCECVSV
jgi:hypothetical protein